MLYQPKDDKIELKIISVSSQNQTTLVYEFKLLILTP